MAFMRKILGIRPEIDWIAHSRPALIFGVAALVLALSVPLPLGAARPAAASPSS